MSKSVLKTVVALLPPPVVAEIDRLRGDVSRSKFMERAAIRLLDEMNEGQVTLLPEAIKTKEELRAEEAATTQK